MRLWGTWNQNFINFAFHVTQQTRGAFVMKKFNSRAVGGDGADTKQDSYSDSESI
jgi:hypothetical protein